MERLEPGSGEMESPRLDGILMGDDDDVAVGMLGIESPRHRRHALGHLLDLLGGEVDAGRIVEVRLELAGES